MEEPHGELIHVQLAEDQRSRALQALDGTGAVGGNEVFEHPRAAGGAQPFGHEDVFMRERHAEELPCTRGLTTRAFCICGGSLRLQGVVDADERV